MRRAFWCGFLSAALFVMVPAASAVTLISNLGGTPLSSTLFGPGSTTIFKAAGWTMPAGDNYFLDGVTLDLAFTGSGLAQVEIWTGVGTPTTPEITLDSPAQGGAGLFTFTPSAPFVMSAGTTYWARVSAGPGSDPFNWNARVEAPTGLATGAGYIFNGSPSTFMNAYEVTGSVVPEPASWGLALLGACAVLALRRR